METGPILEITSRDEWRVWLNENCAVAKEIWIVLKKKPSITEVTYLDSVEEAICFGWIDGIAKSYNEKESLQRFTPRRLRSNWTELNKARARYLENTGKMTEAGRKVLPDLSLAFNISSELEKALRGDPIVWNNYLNFPELYQRVRAGYIQEVRKNEQEFKKRLNNFIEKTRKGVMFGNWNDGGKLSSDY